jgi:PKD repeat protein
MTGSSRRDRPSSIISGGMRYSLFAFLVCIAVTIPSMLVQPGVQNVRADGSSVTNDRVGDLAVFSQDYSGMSSVPTNVCLAADSMSGSVSNLNLSYNATSHCVSVDAAAGAVGKLFVGGLSPSLATTITIDMGIGRTEDHATVNVYAGGAWLGIRLRNGTPTDDLIITSYYYTYSNPTLYSATSVTPDVGFNDGGRFEIKIVSDCASRTNTIYLNGVEKLTTPYTRYLPYSLIALYDPFVNPFVHFAFDSIYSGQTAYLQLYSIQQTVPKYSYITPISNPKLTSFGVDGPHPWDTVDWGLSLVDCGTIWADVKSIARYSPSDMAALKALIADGWELGIHYSARLYDLPLADSLALMDAETAQITSTFGKPPTSFCSLQGADNITHAEYAYTNFGMVSRTGVNGCGAGLSSIVNLGDNCWTFWGIASAAGIVIPTFTHETDVTPAIVWSISPDNFLTYVSNYENRGVGFIGFREYWEKAQNSYHTAISNVVSDPGVSLSFTVANIGGKSRLLVNAPWATAVRDGSGASVPFEVAGSGIVVEVEAGSYTVSAGLHADFSADRTAAVVGQAVQFTNLSMGGVAPLSYDWDFGDGTESTLQNPSHSYSSAGTYTVALEVTDSAARTDTETRSGYITVTTSPPPNNPPNKPVNSSPANGASGVSLTPTLRASAFSDPDSGDTHAASRWQIRTAAGNYSSPAFDSGTDTTHLTSILVPALSYSTTYYWHVRYQDDRGDWSSYSNETSFITAAPPNQEPDRPENVSPATGATGASLVSTLSSSPFSDPDSGDTHGASQWQVTAVAGDYSSPVFDSDTDGTNLTSISIPSGILAYSTTHYWHVRYQDNRGDWSSYSSETSFTTAAPPNQAPSQPDNVSPPNGDGGVSLSPTLTSAAFSDADSGDTHAASQWQVTSAAGDYSSRVYDSGSDTTNLTGISVPSGMLSYSMTYYWRVRHQDDRGAWSDWSAETSFATTGLPVDATPPTTPTVSDDGPTTAATTSLHATWAATDTESGVVEYQYAIGTSAGGTDVVGWTSAGADSGVNRNGLSLTAGATYYFSVRARNGDGLWSAVGVSDGIKVIEEIHEQDPAPAAPEGNDEGLPFWMWIWIPVGLGVVATAGTAILFARR